VERGLQSLSDHSTFELSVFDISYFSGKMQAYLRYKQIPHTTREAQWTELAFDLVEQAGVMEVPLVRRPDGSLMRDTTAMILWFEERFRLGSVVPSDPALAFVARLIEDYADEGLWRPALYYRWAFDADAQLYARRFQEDFLKIPVVRRLPERLRSAYLITRQRRAYLAGEGITDTNRGDVENHYLDELCDMEAILSHRAFLLGSRPSLVDFGYFASMFRHFSIDPTPSKIMRNQAPAVYAWVARLWNSKVSELAENELCELDMLSKEPAMRNILQRIARLYLPYMLANARAVDAGNPSFDVELDGKLYPSMPAIPFRAWSRKTLQQAYAKLATDDRLRVDAVLGPPGCLSLLIQDEHLNCRYPEGDQLPNCFPRTLTMFEKFKLIFTGTPHHKEAGVRRLG
jgi:glutathione S-transferase